MMGKLVESGWSSCFVFSVFVRCVISHLMEDHLSVPLGCHCQMSFNIRKKGRKDRLLNITKKQDVREHIFIRLIYLTYIYLIFISHLYQYLSNTHVIIVLLLKSKFAF